MSGAALPKPGAVTPLGSSALLRLDMHGYWHPGTGRGDGLAADAVVKRDAFGLPAVPGRSLKGLLRECVRLGSSAGLVGDGLEEHLFGTALAPGADVSSDNRVRRLEEHRFATRPGALRVGTARLGATAAELEMWARFARSEEGRRLVRTLTDTLSSTKLEDGVAADQTLRTIEVWVPMTLHAHLEYAPPAGDDERPPQWSWADLDACVRLFLRGLGSHRNRGLGRCEASLLEVA